MSTTAGVSVEGFLEGDFPPGAWLVEGEVVVNDPTFEHQRLSGLVYRRLAEWVESPDGHGVAGYGGNWTIAPGSAYKPDAWWVAAGHEPTGARSDRAPDLVVEVRSPGTWVFDVGIKRERYEQAGVGELWLVDTPARAVLVHRRSSAESAMFDVAFEAGGGEILTTPMLPSLALDLGELFG